MSLSREEFRDGILMAGIPMTENEIESLLNVLDKDGDGEINYRFDQSAFSLQSCDFGHAQILASYQRQPFEIKTENFNGRFVKIFF